jgi:hypothetical protein
LSKSNEYHILNGDVLFSQFPSALPGELIIFRECLVDGPVNELDRQEFYKTRSEFIALEYGCINPEDYYTRTVPEIEKIESIEDKSIVNLWFEDDLFCQVNLWFILDILFKKSITVYLVRPKKITSQGFSCYSEKGLTDLYETRDQIDFADARLSGLESLWNSYQTNNIQALNMTAQYLNPVFPFIFNSVRAHIERQPAENFPGRPVQSLRNIIDELGTSDFGPVFKEFCKREYIYGFGDLQVKRLMKNIPGECVNEEKGTVKN